jgi:hypothetical protein
LALVALSVIEQRYRAVMAVLDGAAVTGVAAEVGVSRQAVHAWAGRYVAVTRVRSSVAFVCDEPERLSLTKWPR